MYFCGVYKTVIMKTYKFVRVHKKGTSDYGTWYFKPQSIEDVNLHWKEICGAEIKSHVNERFEKSVLIEREGKEPYIKTPHPTTQFGMAVEAYMQVCNGIYALGMLEVENIAYQTRINSFNRGDDIYLANGMPVYMIDDRFFEIAETVESEKFAYPTKKNWCLDDVRYMQWNMLGNRGTHWYAKIEKRDIYDEQGRMKWDTKDEAVKAAEWFIKNKLAK